MTEARLSKKKSPRRAVAIANVCSARLQPGLLLLRLAAESWPEGAAPTADLHICVGLRGGTLDTSFRPFFGPLLRPFLGDPRTLEMKKAGNCDVDKTKNKYRLIDPFIRFFRVSHPSCVHHSEAYPVKKDPSRDSQDMKEKAGSTPLSLAREAIWIGFLGWSKHVCRGQTARYLPPSIVLSLPPFENIIVPPSPPPRGGKGALSPQVEGRTRSEPKPKSNRSRPRGHLQQHGV